jgi:hypothetical protein
MIALDNRFDNRAKLQNIQVITGFKTPLSGQVGKFALFQVNPMSENRSLVAPAGNTEADHTFRKYGVSNSMDFERSATNNCRMVWDSVMLNP